MMTRAGVSQGGAGHEQRHGARDPGPDRLARRHRGQQDEGQEQDVLLDQQRRREQRDRGEQVPARVAQRHEQRHERKGEGGDFADRHRLLER
jgi:hypothetical protein